MTIGDLEVGAQARVIGYNKGPVSYRSRLLAMGVTRGELLHVRRMAPMGDPVEILLKGFALVLRKDEASAVLVERIG
ncbi:MAG: ferrous iron transport protein A [Magnetococcales bacterium]|nr:ferrous iron transport protein A [Magnetococcales bacterium]